MTERNKMRNLHFNDFEDFIACVGSKIQELSKDDFGVSIIAKYDEARVIIQELVIMGYEFGDVYLYSPEFSEYTDEYVISIIDIGDGFTVYCEPMKIDNEYAPEESTYIYVLDNCSSRVLPYCKSSKTYEVGIGHDDYDELNDGGFGVKSTVERNTKCNKQKCCKSVDENATKKSIDEYKTRKTSEYHITVNCGFDNQEVERIARIIDSQRLGLYTMWHTFDYFDRLLDTI